MRLKSLQDYKNWWGKSHHRCAVASAGNSHFYFVARAAEKSPALPLLAFATLFLSEWVLHGWRESSAPCLFMLHEELLSLCSGFMTKPLIVHSGSDASVCSRITPDECLGQPLRYLLHLLKNSRMRREVCQLILSAVDLKRLGSVCL